MRYVSSIVSEPCLISLEISMMNVPGRSESPIYRIGIKADDEPP
jgi:hypothetical protein